MERSHLFGDWIYVWAVPDGLYLWESCITVDIRKHGSGNAGTTNALRTMGWKAGAMTLLGDCFKCVFAVVLVRLSVCEKLWQTFCRFFLCMQAIGCGAWTQLSVLHEF